MFTFKNLTVVFEPKYGKVWLSPSENAQNARELYRLQRASRMPTSHETTKWCPVVVESEKYLPRIAVKTDKELRRGQVIRVLQVSLSDMWSFRGKSGYTLKRVIDL